MTQNHPPGDYATRTRIRVRMALAKHEVSAAEVARRAGWKQSYIARRLTRTDPVPFTVTDIEAIADALGIPVADLVTERTEVAA